MYVREWLLAAVLSFSISSSFPTISLSEETKSPLAEKCCICLWDDSKAEECSKLKDSKTCGEASFSGEPNRLSTDLDTLINPILTTHCYWNSSQGCISWNLDACLKEKVASADICKDFSILAIRDYSEDAHRQACGTSNDIRYNWISHGFPVTVTGKPIVSLSCDARRDTELVRICLNASPRCRSIQIHENSCYIAADLGEYYLELRRLQELLAKDSSCECQVEISAHQLRQIQTSNCPDTMPADRVSSTVRATHCQIDLPKCSDLEGQLCACDGSENAGVACEETSNYQKVTSAMFCLQSEPLSNQCHFVGSGVYRPFTQALADPRR